MKTDRALSVCAKQLHQEIQVCMLPQGHNNDTGVMQGFDSYDIFTEIIIGRILHALMWQKSHVFSKCKTQKPHFEKII